jgi:mortality factor 4-like protein 1
MKKNKKIQLQLKIEYLKLKKKKKNKGIDPKKRKMNFDNKLNDNEIINLKCNFEFPEILKNRLINDWDHIMKQKDLIKLPRIPSVHEILTSYIHQYQENMNSQINEVILDLQNYFNKSLGILLLYRFERQQYREILKTYPNKKLSEIYGVEHLLRLFVKFPQLLSSVEIEQQSLEVIKLAITNLIKYIADNLITHILPAYEPASPQYIKQAS